MVEEEAAALSVWAVACLCGSLRLEHVSDLPLEALLCVSPVNVDVFYARYHENILHKPHSYLMLGRAASSRVNLVFLLIASVRY